VFRAINAGQGTDQKGSSVRNDEYTLLKLRKSSKILERPIRSKRETQTFIIVVKVNGQKAVALLDSGCTTDAVTLELTRIVGLKIYELKEQVPLQLRTRGSQ
jgi:predicted aspartyl protease